MKESQAEPEESKEKEKKPAVESEEKAKESKEVAEVIDCLFNLINHKVSLNLNEATEADLNNFGKLNSSQITNTNDFKFVQSLTFSSITLCDNKDLINKASIHLILIES